MSRNSSNIPVPKFKRTLSSDCLKEYQTKKGLKRSNSSDHLAVPAIHPYRSSIRSDIKRDHGGSIPNLASASKAASSYNRSLATPLRMGQGNTRLYSPALCLTTQKINDKKFSNEQFRKTCAFLEDRVDDFDPKLLKTLTLATFVNIVTILFNEIDPRIKINMENYKETIFKYMKLYKYPGPVSISMLKSAYTSLSWAPIMAMCGWLVDLINYSNGENCEDDKLQNYIALGYKEKLKGMETKNLYVNYIDEVLNLDRHKYDVLSSECDKFENEKNELKKIVDELKSKENNLSKEFERMQLEMVEFNEGTLETKIRNEINHLKAECDKRELKIEEMKSSITETREIISTQKYSLKDKEDFAKTLEDLHYTLDIKKEKLESIKKLKDECDYKQTNFRRQIEAEIHEINGRLLQVKLVLLDADIKKVQLPDRGFHTQQFLETVEKKKQLIQSFKEKVERELADATNALNEYTKKWEVVSNEYTEKTNEITSLEEELDKVALESERLTFENGIVKHKLEQEIAALMENAPDLSAVKKRKFELHKELYRLQDEVEQLSDQYIEFFKKLHADAVIAGGEMRNMMADIYDKCYEAYQHQLEKMIAISDALSERDGV